MHGTLGDVTAPSSPDAPWPVRTVARKVADWIGRLGEVWVEGQVAQLSRRGGAATVFLTLRDPAADMSVPVTCHRDVADRPGLELTEGARVVVRARPDYYVARGSFSLRATEIRAVGLGELLARIERIRQLLAAEGLFDAVRKRPLPFAPAVVGVITGRDSAAERDVLVTARRRWPAVRFEMHNCAVQGPDGGGLGHRGPAAPGRRPGGRGHRRRPRRRLRRGPAALLRRGARAGHRRLPDARGHRRRPRDRHHPGRPRGRRPGRHPHRRRPPHRPRDRRAAAPRRRAAHPGPRPAHRPDRPAGPVAGVGAHPAGARLARPPAARPRGGRPRAAHPGAPHPRAPGRGRRARPRARPRPGGRAVPRRHAGAGLRRRPALRRLAGARPRRGRGRRAPAGAGRGRPAARARGPRAPTGRIDEP